MTLAKDKTRDSIIRSVKSALVKAQEKPLAEFAALLFDNAASEDMAVLHKEALIAIARDARDQLQHRKADTEIVSIHPSKARPGGLAVQVINDNMPFLFDSVMSELQKTGADIALVLHPVLSITRDKKGELEGLKAQHKKGPQSRAIRESLIHIEIDAFANPETAETLEANLHLMLKDVRMAVKDWKSMLLRLEETILNYKTTPPPLPAGEIEEAVAFLQWLVDQNFTFLGMRNYAFSGGPKRGTLKRNDDDGLGILRDPNVRVLRRGREMVTMTPEIREFFMTPEPLIITKANVKSRVHRATYMDYVGVKTFDEKGRLSGELRIVGLFTSTAYTRSVKQIPMLRKKVEMLLETSEFDKDSHAGKALLNVAESYPRDELFQIDLETLSDFADKIRQLDERPRLRVLSRLDKFDRFVSVLVYVPRDRYNSTVRSRIGEYLKTVYQGRLSAYYPAFPEGNMARVHFIIGRSEGETPKLDQAELEAQITEIVRTWDDDLRLALGSAGAGIFEGAFPVAYQDAFSGAQAVEDIARLTDMGERDDISISFGRDADLPDDRVSLKVFAAGHALPLSKRVPLLENMGFAALNERTYQITPTDRPPVYLYDMTLQAKSGAVDLSALGDKLTDCFLAIWQGRAENDGYNSLILNGGLAWRDIALLRTISRYLRQTRIPFSQDYMWSTLNRYSAIAGELVTLFHARFDPANADEAAEEASFKRFLSALDDVVSLDDDRILRRFANVIKSSVRTNFYQLDEAGAPMRVISLKIESRKVDELPQPRPFREIFVYSPDVEGVHLRFGKVARGGLRWSDRAQDFRTEVLGLVKAQQVKNAVIVPVGSKGGFYPKQLPDPAAGREAWFEAGRDAYKIFIDSLLDITDNLDGDTVIPPKNVLRHEADDPYLVVAADKGTATFSDTANGISEDHDFWLGDAFASGGSAGYDHKKMGITARGGWEAVKRHFREMNRDIQTEPFTACGVGDMSGDVFGNGMLLSKATKLVAAFDHRDIFIDPDPDPVSSWEERKRLFDMGRSSWQDYSTKLISKGGGVFSRSAKSIPLSAAMKNLLGLSTDRAAPNDILTAILKLDTDLLWFGGIGTYIRATSESDADAGDKANDGIRITAPEVRAKAIGEGANLGVTQKARIEYDRLGGRINTDAIDNSAGVNSSDMEVNIKVALGAAIRSGRLDLKKRNRFLASMTDEVADLVLRNNYLQTLSLSLTEREGMDDFGFQARLMDQLEERGLLDRAVELLPDGAAMKERQVSGDPLTRPEIAVLLAYAKIVLFDDLLASDVPDDPYLARELFRYFPDKMAKTYVDEISAHRLRREIIATMLANSLINRGGATILTRVADQSGAAPAEITRAFAIVRDSFGLTDLNTQIDALDAQIDGPLQLELYARVRAMLTGRIIWFLKNADLSLGIASVVEKFTSGIATLQGALTPFLPDYLKDQVAEAKARFLEGGVPDALADRIAGLHLEAMLPDMVQIAQDSDRSLEHAAQAYLEVAGLFKLGRLDTLAQDISITDYFDGLAVQRARQVLGEAHRAITANVLAASPADKVDIGLWIADQGAGIGRTSQAVDGVVDSGTLTVSKIAVAAGLLSDLADK
jgi:glutamate dehydrogenase